MAAISKFFQVTQQLLVEYKTDQYKIIQNTGTTDAVAYMYQAADGDQYCMLTQNMNNTKFADENDSTFYYPGPDFSRGFTDTLKDDPTLTEEEAVYYGQKYIMDIAADDENISTDYTMQILKPAGSTASTNAANGRSIEIYKDKIKIYLISGYVLNNLAGITINVQAKVTEVKKGNKKHMIKDYLTLLDWFMPKDQLKDKIHWMPSPLYLNSKFYDRYIEIEFPSPYDVALNGSDRNIDYIYADDDYYRGTPSPSADILINFATVSPENYTEIGQASVFRMDAVQTMAIKMDSNANYFNVQIYEDPETRSVMYYPVYGDGANLKDFSIDVMAAIDSGNIPMFDYADDKSHQYDPNKAIDDFIELYGDDTYRWVIINELSVCYNYRYIIEPDTPDTNLYAYTEYFTNTIDYTGKTYDHGEFWKSKFIPYIKPRDNMQCNSIIVKYSCHLFNRLNNTDIIRVATLVITDPYRYMMNPINVDNITTYKIINQVQKIDQTNIQQTSEVNEKYVRQYYDVTNIVIRDAESGQMYTQGKMTLRLKHTNSNYMFRLFQIDSNNVRVPYDLTGSYKYKLVFPSVSGGKIEVFPNVDSQNYNLGIGSLVFYITEDMVKSIMSVPRSERYFALTTDMEKKSQESSLYEGSVEYYT